MDKTRIIERERRWSLPAALATLVAVALFIASAVLVSTKFGASGDAELLRKVNADSGTFLLAYGIRAVGAALLAVPLLYLFRAAQARSETMRGQLVGLVIAGPIFYAGFSLLTGLSVHEAAPDFLAVAKARHALGTGDHADKVAQDVINHSSVRDLAAGFGFGGALGLAFAMAYTALHSMRTGLLTRFWGSLGMALGVASILFFQYTMIWFAYVGLLIAGWLPKRPPAWAAGEAVPWPTPGERMAESMKREEGSAPGSPQGGAAQPADADQSRQPGMRRKRKQRR